MAEPQFTEAGQFGRNLRGALADAYRGFNSGFTKYVQEPLLNFYPQVIANPTYSATEAVAGAFDTPLNLGRFPYYNIETEDERNNKLIQESEPPEPKPTLANRDLLSEYYGGFDNVPLRKAKPITEKLYRVMFAGEGAENSIIAETKEEADRILKESGKKGAVAGVNMRQKTRGGEMLTAEQSEKRSEEYIGKAIAPQQKETNRLALLEKYRSPEYKQEVLAKRKQANEAKAAIDKAEGAKFAGWLSNVKAGRASEGALNDYNKQLGLLKQSYAQARASGDPLAAFQINEYIQEYQSGIPKEMGARKRFAESGALRERNEMLRKKMEEARIQAERDRRLAMVNPDYNR